ncbi:MAG: hypothetical protein AB1640_07825 [bacterium]
METKRRSRSQCSETKTTKVIPFPPRTKSAGGCPRIYTLRVYLIRGPYGEEAVGKEIYRTLQVRGDQSLEDLHYAIFCSFGRDQDESYEYCFGKDPYDRSGPRYVCWESKPPPGTSMRQKIRAARLCSIDSLTLQENQFFSYWFGVEEEWMHLVHVLSIDTAGRETEYPLLIEEVGRAPEASADSPAEPDPGADADPSVVQEVMSFLMSEFQVRWRREVESAPLKPNLRLSAALKTLPVPWLEGVCQKSGVEEKAGGRSREARIQSLLGLLPDEERLRKVWRSLPLPSRQMLDWIVSKQGGWTTVQRLSRRFGADRDLTWWWNEGHTPVTPLGLLRLHGIVYVGKTQREGRNCRIASVPIELRKHLQRIAREPGSMDECVPSTPSRQAKPGGCDHRETSAKRRVPCGRHRLPDVWQGLDSLSLGSFLSVCTLRRDTEGLYIRMLGRIRRNPRSFPRVQVQEFLRRMCRAESVCSRLAAYRLGASTFGPSFAEPGCRDDSPVVRQWARSLLEIRQEELF